MLLNCSTYLISKDNGHVIILCRIKYKTDIISNLLTISVSVCAGCPLIAANAAAYSSAYINHKVNIRNLQEILHHISRISLILPQLILHESLSQYDTKCSAISAQTLRAWAFIICSAFSFWYCAIFSSIAGTSIPSIKLHAAKHFCQNKLYMLNTVCNNR